MPIATLMALGEIFVHLMLDIMGSVKSQRVDDSIVKMRSEGF